MAGKIAVDFGTSNTVIARWDEASQEGVSFHIPGYGRRYQQGDETISLIPSLIHYTTDKRRWIGQQVLSEKLLKSPQTFKFMKIYIRNRSPRKINVNGRQLSHADAGADFLKNVLLFASEELEIGNEEVAFTVPVEAFEDYDRWLSDTAEQAGISRYRLIDEASAAALGYGAQIQPGDVYLVFDFGGGTLDVGIFILEDETNTRGGRPCRALGKAAAEIGGTQIDQWLFEEVLRQNSVTYEDDSVRLVSNGLLIECERAKIRLSTHDRADISEMNPESGAIISAEITRSRFVEILDEHDAFSLMHQTVRRALNHAREHGYDEDSIKSVLMVGGSSQIPSVQRTLQRIFGRERVRLDRPMDAVARGAAAFVAGVDFYDHIQHDYAIRYFSREIEDYAYKTIVAQGTSYPTKKPLLKKDSIVKTAHDGQTELGIAIFELSELRNDKVDSGKVRIEFDPNGAARLVNEDVAAAEKRNYFWMNEGNPTFLKVKHAAKRGEPCYQVNFAIDENKRLLITAREVQFKNGKIVQGGLVLKDYPVIKLT